MRRIFLSFLLAIALVFSLNAQKDSTQQSDGNIKYIFTTVQEPAEFEGGLNGWKNYLEENLNANLGSKFIKVAKGQKSVKATVIVSFVIDRDGNVSNVYAEKTISALRDL